MMKKKEAPAEEGNTGATKMFSFDLDDRLGRLVRSDVEVTIPADFKRNRRWASLPAAARETRLGRHSGVLRTREVSSR